MPQVKSRYLFVAGGFVAGGWFTGLGPKKNESAAIETVAPVHLPMVGGVSKAKTANLESKRRGKKLMKMLSGSASVEAQQPEKGKPAVSTTFAEVAGVEVDGLFLDEAVLNMSASQKPSADQPSITFGETYISGLVLDGNEITVTVDIKTLNRYPTMISLEEAFYASKLPESFQRTLAVDESGTLHRSQAGYVVGSLVSNIEGTLPAGAFVEPNGYVICWPNFGRIILGELTMSGYLRRVTMMRLEHSDDEFGSGCSGGSYYP